MCVEQRIDDLIEAGWDVLKSDFDPVALQGWRRKAFHCLTAVVGPDHVYTRHFANFVEQGPRTDLLAACGIHRAIQHEIAGNGAESVRCDDCLSSVSFLCSKGSEGAAKL